MAAVKDSYDRDFYEWTRETAEKIRQGSLSGVDLEALAEEVEDLGKRDRREVVSRLEQILLHLLKWQFQPDYREVAGEKSWRTSIKSQRKALVRVFADSPSLHRHVPASLDEAYKDAVEEAADETGLPPRVFPRSCPWTVEQILDPEFFPEA